MTRRIRRCRTSQRTWPSCVKPAYYYEPIEKRLALLRERHQGHTGALEVFAMEEREIVLYREYSDFYSTYFYVMRSHRIS